MKAFQRLARQWTSNGGITTYVVRGPLQEIDQRGRSLQNAGSYVRFERIVGLIHGDQHIEHELLEASAPVEFIGTRNTIIIRGNLVGHG